MTPVRILLADDHPIVRDGLKMLLDLQPDMTVVAAVKNGVEALNQVHLDCPDIAILDIGMPEMNGIDCAAEMQRLYPQIQIIMLSMHDTSEYIIRAIQAGAKGYLLKDSLSQEIIRAIHTVHMGNYIVSKKIARLLSTLEVRIEDIPAAKSPLSSLAPQENRVLQHVVEGLTSAEIAELLSLSPKTVETYRSRIMRKLGVDSIAELVKFAIVHGITSLTS